MKWNEIISLSVLSVLTILLLIKAYNDKENLRQKGVVVLGRLTSSSFGGDGGWDHNFEYKVNTRTYHTSFNGPIPFFTLSDSLIFLKVQKDNPKNCRIIMDVKVPGCFTYPQFNNVYWHDFPECP